VPRAPAGRRASVTRPPSEWRSASHGPPPRVRATVSRTVAGDDGQVGMRGQQRRLAMAGEGRARSRCDPARPLRSGRGRAWATVAGGAEKKPVQEEDPRARAGCRRARGRAGFTPPKHHACRGPPSALLHAHEGRFTACLGPSTRRWSYESANVHHRTGFTTWPLARDRALLDLVHPEDGPTAGGLRDRRPRAASRTRRRW